MSKWRTRFRVHPAADVFPMMSDEELAGPQPYPLQGSLWRMAAQKEQVRAGTSHSDGLSFRSTSCRINSQKPWKRRQVQMPRYSAKQQKMRRRSSGKRQFP